MKRLCLILAYLFLFTQTASAMPLLVGQKVVYRGTITDLRISAVDGTAFIDNAGATIPTYADGNHSIEIYDSSNRMLKGVLKAAGTSETLAAASNVSNCINSVIAPFDAFTDASPTGFTAQKTTEGTKRASTADEIVVAIGELWKVLYSFSVTSGTLPTAQFRNAPGGAALGVSFPSSAAGDNIQYTTTTRNDTGVIEVMATTDTLFTASGIAARKVTTPSATGATIVSAKGGEVYNFSYKNASFTYNAASYYVIIRAIR